MEKSLYLAAMQGNVDFLREVREREIESGCWDNFFQTLTPQKNNIIHIASQYHQFEFLKSGFDFGVFSPHMVSQGNADGDTPIHVASKRGNKRVVELLVEVSRRFLFREVSISSEVVEEEGDNEGDEEQKWALRVTNLEGNTAVHEALINGKLDVAKCLIGFDPCLASFINKNGETPLHLAIRYNVDGDKKLAIDAIEQLNKQQASLSYKGCLVAEESESMIRLLLQKHKAAICTKDNEGLTPLLRAALQSHLRAIEVLLEECPDSSEMRDCKGKTILHLVKFRTYEEAKNYLLRIPQMLALKDQQDDEGNTPAHVVVKHCITKARDDKITYEKAKEDLLRIMPQMLALKDQQDDEGNTPAHKVVMDCIAKARDDKVVLTSCDGMIGVIKALLELSTNFTLKNKDGDSAASLISQQLKSHFSNNGTLLKLEEMEMKETSTSNKPTNILALEDLIERNKDKLPELELKTAWKALIDVNVQDLRKEIGTLGEWLLEGILNVGDLYHLLKASKVSYEHIEKFMKELLEKNPILINQINKQGDTLLHLMVKESFEMSESFLHKIQHCYNKEGQRQHDEDGVSGLGGGVYCPPWMVKNIEGNTPLHEALLHAPEHKIVKFLIDCDCDVSSYVNNRSETPLHVLCRSKVNEIDKDTIELMIKANIMATYTRDSEGLTPLLRAAKQGRLKIVKQLCSISPESAQLRDHEGKTFWHMMDMSGKATEDEKKIEDWALNNDRAKLKALASSEDNDRKTPLCIAFEKHNYNLAQVLKNLTDDHDIYKDKNLWKDKDETNYNIFMLSFAKRLTSKLEATLWDNLKTIGEKSIYGIPESQISNYTNTIGVVATLLATIALTGAFQVPGGSDSTGYPVLLHPDRKFLVRAAFWTFMVSDILTMCFSIMVLYCLLWVMTGDKKDKLVITDFTIFLLQLSFITTMVSLMMGVFASTFHHAESLAVFTLVVCSTVLLLLQKKVVMVPLQYILITGYLVKKVTYSAISNWCNCDKTKSRKIEKQEVRAAS